MDTPHGAERRQPIDLVRQSETGEDERGDTAEVDLALDASEPPCKDQTVGQKISPVGVWSKETFPSARFVPGCKWTQSFVPSTRLEEGQASVKILRADQAKDRWNKEMEKPLRVHSSRQIKRRRNGCSFFDSMA